MPIQRLPHTYGLLKICTSEGLSSDLTGFTKVANEEMVPLLNSFVLIYEDMSHNISVKMTEQMESNNVNLIQTFENVQHIHNRIKIISVNASIIASKARNTWTGI